MATYHNLTVGDFRVMIPSATVRNYARKVAWDFTDLQRACLITNSDKDIECKVSFLKRLQKSTNDSKLYAQIESYISGVSMVLDSFRNEGKHFIFILYLINEDRDYFEPEGYFNDLSLAIEKGKTAGCKFRIEKRNIIMDLDKDEDFYAEAFYDKDGLLLSIAHPNDSVLSTYEDQSNFSMAYIDVPNPFNRGDIVYVAGEESNIGIVETSQEFWNRCCEINKKPLDGFPIDFLDVSINVVFLMPDGTFAHSHINPIKLEKYEIQGDWHHCSPRDRLLRYTQLLYEGEESIETYSVLQKEFVDWLKQQKDNKIS